MSRKVIVTDCNFPALEAEEAAAKAAGATFTAHRCRTDAEVAEAVTGADVVAVQFARFGPLSAASVRPGATVIRYGVGYDNIDLAAAASRGLKVGYVPDYCADEVAEHAAAAVLSLLRRLAALDASVRAGEWDALETAGPIKPFARTVVGLFGMGRIGENLRARLAGFGFEFIAADPELTPARAKAVGVELVDADALLARADIVSLHAPATPETVDFFDAARLAKMGPRAMIVNSARGQLIVEEDLARALTEGVIAGAALDVFRTEPLPADSPLRSAPNCLLSPHAAWYSDSAIGRLQRLMADDIARALDGRPPRRAVPGT